MKYVKILIILLEVLLALGSAFAQNKSIGFRTGASYFTINNEAINEDAQYTMGLDLAIPVEFRLSSVFSIQPELHFTQKGVRFEDQVDGKDQSIAVKTNFVELPVLLKASYGQKKFRASIFLAPSVAYATKRFTVEQLGDADKVKEDVDFIDTAYAKSQRWELSVIGGLETSMKAGVGAIVLDVRYSLGLTDNTRFKTEKPADWEKTTNRGCTISVGYMIPFGGK